MKKWLMRLIDEKGIDLEKTVEVDGKGGINIIPMGVIVEHILVAPKHEQKKIKHELVMIDFKNGDIEVFLKYLAKAIAI